MSKYEACESVNKNQPNFQTGAYHRKVPGFKPEMFKVGFFVKMMLTTMMKMRDVNIIMKT